ncbi:hypothetical protein Sango_1892600 [Sesamum angolense]|uniref:CCHC-type domain-containing protein n=1 Tax=Sesamum angolense TaxID=2727404 RepID=A0AAE2BQU5_9LAMI|nr:hypothetical protein Sango_1892600 [Sesamum angolense]
MRNPIFIATGIPKGMSIDSGFFIRRAVISWVSPVLHASWFLGCWWGTALSLTEEDEADWVGIKEVDSDNSCEVWGSSVRIRVAIDITKPLKRALKIHTVLGDELMISFTYERLLNFCYLCGCLGHLLRQCERQLQEDFKDQGDNPPYGSWLRAADPLQFRGRHGGNMSREGPITPTVNQEIAGVRKELECIAAHTETVWRQHSKEAWLREEDSVQQCILDHFGEVYKANGPQPNDIARGTEYLQLVEDASMGEELLQPYTVIEVTKALSQMAPLKSPGPNFWVSYFGEGPSSGGTSLTLPLFTLHKIVSLLHNANEGTLFVEFQHTEVGKEVLIKFVVQAIPTYAIGCFRLPITLLRETQSIIAKCWWSNYGSHKMHRVSSDRLCESKFVDGLGFRHLHLFSLAMLAKQL